MEVRTAFSVIIQNWSALISFELIYKIVGISLFFPSLGSVTNYLPDLINESHLSQENIVRLFSSPAAIFGTVVRWRHVGSVSVCRNYCINAILRKSWNREKITAWKLVRMSFIKILGMFNIRRVASFSSVILYASYLFRDCQCFFTKIQDS